MNSHHPQRHATPLPNVCTNTGSKTTPFTLYAALAIAKNTQAKIKRARDISVRITNVHHPGTRRSHRCAIRIVWHTRGVEARNLARLLEVLAHTVGLAAYRGPSRALFSLVRLCVSSRSAVTCCFGHVSVLCVKWIDSSSGHHVRVISLLRSKPAFRKATFITLPNPKLFSCIFRVKINSSFSIRSSFVVRGYSSIIPGVCHCRRAHP